MASYRIAILITISKRYCPEGVSKNPCKDPVYPAATSSNTQAKSADLSTLHRAAAKTINNCEKPQQVCQ